MENIVNISYSQTGKATSTNSMGMRQMQAKAFEARLKQYILPRCQQLLTEME